VTLIALLLPLIVLSVSAEDLGYSDARVNLDVYPQLQAYSGDNVTVKTRVEALVGLKDVDIYINAYGSKNMGYDSWSTYLSIMNDIDLSRGDVLEYNHSLPIPSEASHGLAYAIIHIHYKYYSRGLRRDYSTDITFQMTYLKDRAYEDLEQKYASLLNEYNEYQQNHSSKYETLLTAYENLLLDRNSLSTTYNSLWSEYNSAQETYGNLLKVYSFLQSEYNALTTDLHLNRSLNWVLLTTVILLIATFLSRRKAKEKREVSETAQQASTESTLKHSQSHKKEDTKTEPPTETEIDPTEEKIERTNIGKGRERGEEQLVQQAEEILH